MHGWYGYGSQMGAWGWVGPAAMILFWILLIVGLAVLIRFLVVKTRSGSSIGGSRRKALEILEERYARGEIDKPEFEQKKHDLA